MQTIAQDYLAELRRAGIWAPHKDVHSRFAASEAVFRYQAEFSYAIPTDEAIFTIVKCGPVVEIGAGNGFWASLVAEAGGNIVAYDTCPGRGNEYTNGKPWFDVRRGSAESSALHPDRTLMLCWPPYNSGMAATALAHYRGDTLVYVGEGEGGCTANGAFFHALKSFEPSATVYLPCFPGVHDQLTVYRR